MELASAVSERSGFGLAFPCRYRCRICKIQGNGKNMSEITAMPYLLHSIGVRKLSWVTEHNITMWSFVYASAVSSQGCRAIRARCFHQSNTQIYSNFPLALSVWFSKSSPSCCHRSGYLQHTSSFSLFLELPCVWQLKEKLFLSSCQTFSTVGAYCV